MLQVHGMWNFSSGIANPQPKNRSQAGKFIPFFGMEMLREGSPVLSQKKKQDCKGNFPPFPPPPRGAKSKENVCPFLVQRAAEQPAYKIFLDSFWKILFSLQH